MNSLRRWKHSVVRDLAWVISSPSLISRDSGMVSDSWCGDTFETNLSALQRLDAAPIHLLNLLEKNQSPRLGRYFEVLVGYWLREISGHEVIAQNLTVSDASRSLGEFDLLFRDQTTCRVMHWELSVKFYLKFKGQFIGPNPRDTFDKKINKVFGQQLRLSRLSEARSRLQSLIGDEPIYPKAFIRGRLFYPALSDWRHPEIIDGISRNHERGWWCYHSELDRWSARCDREHRWLILGRMEWMSPVERGSPKGLLSSLALGVFVNDYFTRAYQALMVAELEFSDGAWVEVSRGVVVDDSWPGKVKADV